MGLISVHHHIGQAVGLLDDAICCLRLVGPELAADINDFGKLETGNKVNDP